MKISSSDKSELIFDVDSLITSLQKKYSLSNYDVPVEALTLNGDSKTLNCKIILKSINGTLKADMKMDKVNYFKADVLVSPNGIRD